MPLLLRIFLIGLMLVGHAFAETSLDIGQSKTAQGLTVYVGSMPAEIMRGYPHEHPQSSIHDGPPGGAHAYHLFVAIFDSMTGVRITDAKIIAQMEGPSLAGPRRPLAPITVGGAVAYGNYFDFPDNSPYTIRLQIERRGTTIRMDFDYGYR